MRGRAVRLLTGTLAVALSVNECPAHVGTVVYPIYEIPSADLPDIEDGSLEDWEEIVPGPSLTTEDFEGIVPLDPGDFAARVFLAWNARTQRIYLGAEIVDDVHYDLLWDIEGYASKDGDQLYLEVDGDHSGGEFVRAAPPDSVAVVNLTNYQGAQTYGAILTNDPELSGFTTARYGNRWSLEPPYAQVGTSVSGEMGSYGVVEMMVTPFDELQQPSREDSRASTLTGNAAIGLDVQFLDLDEVTTEYPRYNQITLRPWRDPWTASEFVDAVLIPCDRLDCSGTTTSVAPSSWARVKMALAR